MLRALVVLFGVLTGSASAQMYTQEELAATKAGIAPNLTAVLREDIIGNLPRAQRPAAARIKLQFPETAPSVLAFYADPGSGTIYMPLASIRFFDDLATLFAWVESKGCDPAAIQSYLYALLRDGQPLPSPLKAFSIDRAAAFADPFTYDVSSKIVSSGALFILAHETGHILLKHKAGLHRAASQAQEIDADAFALEHFERIGALPTGILHYFLASWWQDPDSSEAAATHSHPVSSERIAAIARRISKNPARYSFSQNDPEDAQMRAMAIATELATISDMIASERMLSLIPLHLDSNYPATRFARACPSP